MSDSKDASWGGALAKLWTNYVPPCRPSVSELAICTKYLRDLQRSRPATIAIMVLGSTTEFRDWAHEEGLRCTIIDYSPDYHRNIAWELRYKFRNETVVHQRWQEMSFEGLFDLVVGDLVVGNLSSAELPSFLTRTYRALRPGGYFITKSFFSPDWAEDSSVEDVVARYQRSPVPGHPYAALIYDIAVACVDRRTGELRFAEMYERLRDLVDQGLMERELFRLFENLGWQNNMKFSFYMPTFGEWQEMAAKVFDRVVQEKGNDVYSPDFPIYVLQKTQ
jgi:SAM-dependent methyltransferase